MPTAERTSRPAMVAVLALVVLSAGCITLSGGDTSETAFEDRLETAEPPATVTATLEVTLETDGDRETITEPVWLRDDGTSRIGAAGSEFHRIDDGDRVWRYDGGSDTVSVRDSNETATGYLEYAYGEQERYADEYSVTRVDETTLDGREAFHVVFDPPAEETIERSIRIAIGGTEYVLPLETSSVDESAYADRIELWTDRGRLFPMKIAVVADDFELTMTYTDVAFDEDLDDDLFEFEPPESATVENETVSKTLSN